MKYRGKEMPKVCKRQAAARLTQIYDDSGGPGEIGGGRCTCSEVKSIHQQENCLGQE